MKSNFGLFLLLLLQISYCCCVYRDCENPPRVQHSTNELNEDEETEDLVIAIYKCNDGFKLVGDANLYCNLNSDEWQGEPPTCQPDQQTSSGEAGGNGGRRRKLQNIVEDSSVTDEYAQSLDLSCMRGTAVRGPEIENGAVIQYDKRRRGTQVFLVAFYECDEDYDLEDSASDRMYCSQHTWIGRRPKCVPAKEDDYDDENGDNEEDYDENEREESRRAESVPKTQEPAIESPSEGTYEAEKVEHPENNGIQVTHQEIHEIANSERTENSEEGNGDNEVEIIPQPEVPEEEIPTVDCSAYNGGCDHECEVIDDTNGPRINCKCFSGYTLDPTDGKRCHDIDECQINNGGCEQICINKPGTLECRCDTGLQIDISTGKTCVDINECLLRNGHGPCQDTCHNTWGNYTCSCVGLPGTVLAPGGTNCIDNGDCLKYNGGCSHSCITAISGQIYCLCPSGLQLSSDWKLCEDINECEQPGICGENICENNFGSYVCNEPSVPEEPVQPDSIEEIEEIERKNEIPESRPDSVVCGSGFRANEANECVDIDECAEGIAQCENCQNSNGGYECTCPPGFELGEDERTCVDINECETYGGDNDEENEEESTPLCEFQCVNSVGSYSCVCPPGQHLESDQRSCSPDLCSDLERDPSKGRCSHECRDTEYGYECSCPTNHRLENDGKTCSPSQTDYCTPEHAQRCHPGSCINGEQSYHCECPSGYIDKAGRCHDIDECLLGIHGCSHECVNQVGSYQCECPAGLTLSANNKNCEDIDECQTDEPLCGDQYECVNTYGSYKCGCPFYKEFDHESGKCKAINLCRQNNGGCSDQCSMDETERNVVCSCSENSELAVDGKTCRAKQNPCEVNNGGCAHYCRAFGNDFECHCRDGYQLGDDGNSCVDKDECAVNNGGCEQQCENLDGGYKCSCFSGFAKLDNDHTSCIDINECEVNNGGCDQECHNSVGSYSCSCSTGYLLDDISGACIDIDECSDHNGHCSHSCVNTLGSYHCSCPSGFSLIDDHKTCNSTNPCDFGNAGCSHECVFVDDQVSCYCPKGFKIDSVDLKTCIDHNECEHENGGCSHTCINYHGHHKCECPPGFELTSNGKTCNDIDECIWNNGNCSNICINLIGSHMCACEIGYELGMDKHSCVDIDECATQTNDCSHLCINLSGSYECDCPLGYNLGRDHFTCEDINECELEPNGGCSHNCTNLLGSFECACPDGHRAENKTCLDIDECSENLHSCSHECENHVGNYSCLCPNGYQLKEDQLICTDIDECKKANGGCSHECVNFDGGFQCICPNGTTLDSDGLSCRRINECEFNNAGCSHICHDTDQGYHCSCPEGLTLHTDNHTCHTINPCLTNNGGCSHHCKFIENKTTCSCPNGYELDHADLLRCVDIDECKLENFRNYCPHKCVNIPGSFKCDCHKGFRMLRNSQNSHKGYCVDINECRHFNGGCGAKSKCINLVGSYRCTCASGFKLSRDGKSCVEIKDNCENVVAPSFANMRCTKSRHRTQMFYKTRCKIECKEGYTLVGSPFKHCHGETGQWEGDDGHCVPSSCPRLMRPLNGNILPTECMQDNVRSGQRCTLQCNPGFMPANNKASIICNATASWQPNADLSCIQQWNRRPVFASPPQGPEIMCPDNSTLNLPKNAKTIYIRLQQPKTNVDYARDVEAYPAWGKRLEAHLTAGVHVITFVARSPITGTTKMCKTIIRVQQLVYPEVINCPKSFAATLYGDATAGKVYWTEPSFSQSENLVRILKSKVPGSLFQPGIHTVRYVGVYSTGLNATCEFSVNVLANKFAIGPQQTMPSLGMSRLPNHESYLVCPGRPAIKLETNFPLQLDKGCYVKNVRLPSYNRIGKRHQSAFHANMLKHYSSWDDPLTSIMENHRQWARRHHQFHFN